MPDHNLTNLSKVDTAPNLGHIAADLHPLAMAVSECTIDPGNARTGHDLEAIAASLRIYGQRTPIVINVDEGGKILKGNGTFQAATQLLNWTHIAAVKVRDDPTTAVGYAIADNRTGDLSRWDDERLAQYLQALPPELPTGFGDDDLHRILADLGAGEDGRGGSLGEDADDITDLVDRAAELQQKWETAVGQLWHFPARSGRGGHYLLIGDIEEVSAQARLLACANGAPIKTAVSDPPYGVDYDPAWRTEMGINKATGMITAVEGDDRADWTDVFISFDPQVMYLWHAGRYTHVVAAGLEDHDYTIVSQIIWVKDRFALSRGDYHWQHEPCWYAVKKGETHNWHGGRDQTTTWFIDRLSSNAADSAEEVFGHGTQKPIECMARPIRNNTQPGEWVVDLFVGTGTTLIAAEDLRRFCLAADKKPTWAAVTLERYLLTFGIEPTLVGDG